MSEFIEGLAEILETEVENIQQDTMLGDFAWDSLAVVSTMALVDDVYSVMLDGQALAKCQTVGDIQALITAANGK
ncbi:phosphopantetheine-binding protein [Undibacterium squillarum]|uniref:phosphopantetheine-binding protein n=1 Tax=Undibacterium squillarum TaxID=1131567 RepID=UPI0035B1B2FA